MVLCGTGWADVWWWWWCFAERKTIVTGRDGALGGGAACRSSLAAVGAATSSPDECDVVSGACAGPRPGWSLPPSPLQHQSSPPARTLEHPDASGAPPHRTTSPARLQRQTAAGRCAGEGPHPVLVTYLSLLGDEVRPGRPQRREVTTDPSSPPVPSIPPTGLEPPPAATCMERPSSTGRPRTCSGSHTAPRYLFPVKPAHRPSRQAGSGRAPVRPETLDLSARRATLRGLETSTNVRIRTYVRIVSHRSPGPETHVAGFLKNLGRQIVSALSLLGPPAKDQASLRIDATLLAAPPPPPQLCKPPFGAVAPHSACGWMGCRSSKLRRASVELPSLDDGAVSSRQDKQP